MKLSNGGIQLGGSWWAKKMVVLERKLVICGCSKICSYVSSMLSCWVTMC